MINSSSVLGIVPARGGSKGIPRKNIREVGGKPLIAWTIEQARRSKYIDRLIVSSDDQEIIDVATRYGAEAPFVRPAELAKDDTPGIDPVIHAIESLPGQYEFIVLLQPTSPLRETADIDACLELCVRESAPSCVSVTEPTKSPYWMYVPTDSVHMKPLLPSDYDTRRRQELPTILVLNGAVYVARSHWLLKERRFVVPETVFYFMDRRRSIDVDSEADLKLCDLLLGNGGHA